MESLSVASLRELAEPLVALSTAHLTAATRMKLAADDLSVNAYPNEWGGFVYVGAPRYRIPTEADLATIFEFAERAGIIWLKFDGDAALINGLPVFDESEAEA